MKRLFYAACLFTALLSTRSFGDTLIGRAWIPFNFQVGTFAMPAGSYRIHDSDGVLVVKGTDGNSIATSLTMRTSLLGEYRSSSLEFHRYGDRYFLANVRVWSSGTVLMLPKGKIEKEFARRSMKP